MQMILEERELWHLVEKKVALPTYIALLAKYNKMSKVKRVILDLVKDHLIPHINGKKNEKEMFDALITLSK